jgi:hypothetical protein
MIASAMSRPIKPTTAPTIPPKTTIAPSYAEEAAQRQVQARGMTQPRNTEAEPRSRSATPVLARSKGCCLRSAASTSLALSHSSVLGRRRAQR